MGVLDRFGRLPGMRSLPPVLPVSSRRIDPTSGPAPDRVSAPVWAVQSENTPAVVASVPANAPERNSRSVFAGRPGAPDTRDRWATRHNPAAFPAAAPARTERSTHRSTNPPAPDRPATAQPHDRCRVELGRGQWMGGHGPSAPQRRVERGRFSPARASSQASRART